jgi:serine protease inhibitor ecotin
MAADPANPDAKPDPGDVTICIQCAQLLVFTGDLTLRAAKPGEIEMTPEIWRAQQLVRRLDRR